MINESFSIQLDTRGWNELITKFSIGNENYSQWNN
jgi:hypothetical protein